MNDEQAKQADTHPQVELWRAEIPTRFSDMDAQRHINNLAYLEYIQECRVQWFLSLGLHKQYGTVVVNTNIEYLSELLYPDPVTVIMTASRPGRSSLQTHYEIWTPDEKGTLSARSHAKIVFVDPAKRKSVPIPGIVLDKLQ